MENIKTSKKETPIFGIILFIVSFIVTMILQNIVTREISGKYFIEKTAGAGLDTGSSGTFYNVVGIIGGIVFILITFAVYKIVFRKINGENFAKENFSKFYLFTMSARYLAIIMINAILLYLGLGFYTKVMGVKLILINIFVKLVFIIGTSLILHDKESKKIKEDSKDNFIKDTILFSILALF